MSLCYSTVGWSPSIGTRTSRSPAGSSLVCSLSSLLFSRDATNTRVRWARQGVGALTRHVRKRPSILNILGHCSRTCPQTARRRVSLLSHTNVKGHTCTRICDDLKVVPKILYALQKLGTTPFECSNRFEFFLLLDELRLSGCICWLSRDMRLAKGCYRLAYHVLKLRLGMKVEGAAGNGWNKGPQR